MAKFFRAKPPKEAYLLFLFGIIIAITRFLLDSNFGNSALLYVAIPFLVSVLLFQFTDGPARTTPFKRYIAHLRGATIIMLGTSVVLFEGFICILFFMPIYYIGISIGFVFDLVKTKREKRNHNTLKVSVIPILVGIMAVEGVTPSTSFERQNSITRTVIVDATVDELKANIATPIELPKNREWFLSIFPLPTDIQAGSLQSGDIHKLTFIYKRWFFTNIDKGEFHLRIDEVLENQIKTSVVSNTSYLSKYLEIEGTKIEFNKIAKNKTEVSLTINYNRLLDPAWYFAPLQHIAVSQSADYLMAHVIIRNAPKVEHHAL